MSEPPGQSEARRGSDVSYRQGRCRWLRAGRRRSQSARCRDVGRGPDPRPRSRPSVRRRLGSRRGDLCPWRARRAGNGKRGRIPAAGCADLGHLPTPHLRAESAAQTLRTRAICGPGGCIRRASGTAYPVSRRPNRAAPIHHGTPRSGGGRVPACSAIRPARAPCAVGRRVSGPTPSRPPPYAAVGLLRRRLGGSVRARRVGVRTRAACYPCGRSNPLASEAASASISATGNRRWPPSVRM